MVENIRQVLKNKKKIRAIDETLQEFLDSHPSCGDCVPAAQADLEALKDDFELRGQNHGKVLHALALLATAQILNQRTIIRLLWTLLGLLAAKEGYGHIR